MVVATYGSHPWIATVYYTLDQDLNIYFLSDPNTIHCRQIAKNPKVAITIADSPQRPTSKKKMVIKPSLIQNNETLIKRCWINATSASLIRV